jgi:kynurenine formamidase
MVRQKAEDFRALGRRLSNWGRWGAEDERGTLNLLSSANLVAGAALVRDGRAFELSIALEKDGVQTGAEGRHNPLHIVSRFGAAETYPGGLQWADDYLLLPLQAGTHLDALSHAYYDGKLYNDAPSSAAAATGARRNGIDRLLPGLLGRAVVLDIARLHGVAALEAGYAITPDDLDRAAQAQGGPAIGRGDLLLVRTGWLGQVHTLPSREAFWEAEPGLGLGCATWLHAREVAAVCCDNFGVEVVPSEDGTSTMPLHCVLIRDMGMVLGELFALDALAEDCATDGRWECLLIAAPLKVPGGYGSVVTPVAIK